MAGRGGGEDRAARPAAHVGDFGVGQIERRQRLRPRVQARQMPDAVLRVRADDPLGRCERVGGHAEDPLRHPELGGQVGQLLDASGPPAVKIPPARAVGDEVEHAVRRPLRLEDRFVEAAGDQLGPAERAVGQHVRDPQLAAVPRHVRVIPGQPGQPRAVGAEARVGIEIVARHQHLPAGRVAVHAHAGDRVDRLAAGDRVVFAHADQPAAAAIDDRVGVAQRDLGRDRPRRVPGVLPVEPLIGEIREEDRAAVDDEFPAAVLVDTRASVQRRRRHVSRAAIGRAAHDHVAAALVGPAFGPIDVRAVKADLPQPHRAGEDQVGGDGRFPGTVGRYDHFRLSPIESWISPSIGANYTLSDRLPQAAGAEGLTHSSPLCCGADAHTKPKGSGMRSASTHLAESAAAFLLMFAEKQPEGKSIIVVVINCKS